MLVQLRKRLPEPLKMTLRRMRSTVLSLGLTKRKDFVQPEEEARAGSEISVIVAISDAPAVVLRCLVSLEAYASKVEVILVDDGSTFPETKALLRDIQMRNSWKFIRHESPKGHSRSCEAGARLATRPYLCLLNSDTVVTPWSWEGILRAFESDPNIAVVGPSTSWAATIQMKTRAMHCRHFWTDSQIHGYAERVVAAGRQRPLVDLAEVSGFAFFIRKNVWEQLGGFDLNLPDYGNESELCVRLRERGCRMVWTQGSYIHHFGRQSYGRLPENTLLDKWQLARRYIDKRHPSEVDRI